MKKIKSFLYKIFLLKYGRIKGIKQAQKSNTIDCIKVNLGKKENRIVYIAKNSRLYTDTIHNSSLISNNYLIVGPSYQIVKNNYVSCKHNIVLKIGTPRILKKIKGSTASLLSGGGANANYFHWIYDVLPRLNIINQVTPLKKIDYLLIPSNKKKFQIETLKLIGFNHDKLLPSEKFRHITSEKLIITNHPYIKTKNSGIDELKIPLWVFEWLKKTFISKIKKKNKKKVFDKIFINRKKNNINENYTRILINESKIIDILKKKNFKIINLEDFSFLDQINLFYHAKVIAGVHGAGFANIVFCKKKTRIIEFKTKGAGNLYKSIAIKNKLKYFGFTSRAKNIFNNQNGVISINIKRLKKTI